MINIKNFDPNMLKIYITIKKIDDCKNINSVNPLYLIIDHTSGCIQN